MPRFSFFARQSSGPKATKRTVLVAHCSPPNYSYLEEDYASNKIITSKYTAWNFLFKNLSEQFRRVANFYFLCIAIVQLSIKSPVSPLTSMLPLVFVVSVTAVKQAYEDWVRHKADDMANFRPISVLSKGDLVTVNAQDIKVGDIVLIKNDQESPCDLVILSTSNPNGHCHVTTANLDGETNLKDQLCSEETAELKTPDSLKNLCAIIECDLPNPDLYSFCGKITVYHNNGHNKVSPLNAKNLLLRGATLKNTNFVFGCAIYTGPDTKLVRNLRLTSNKFSSVEKSLNKFLIIFLVVLGFEATISCVLLLITILRPDLSSTWYISFEPNLTFGDAVSNFLSFVVLFNYIIPISLYVTLDLIKFIGTLFFVCDIDMYDKETDQPALCNSSDLNEELGQVNYLFSDKTGTLTENCMVFRECSIGGTKFEERDGKLCCLNENDPITLDVIEHFLLVLILCSTVQINETGSQLEYFASSPDEKALVEACARFGVALTAISNQEYTITTQTGVKNYTNLCTLEFDAERKRMSTIIEDDKGSIFLLCKGADSSMINLLKSGNEVQLKEHIQEYAVAGLRTLVIAEKELTRAEYVAFDAQLHHARCLLERREEMVANVYEVVEHNLQLLGATAIQDRLQESVADTLDSLRLAGIKIWVLTGDHVDTALNVSYACGHIKEGMIKLTLLAQKNSDECFFTLRQLRYRITEEPLRTYFFVMDGVSAAYALQNHQGLLRSVSEMCTAVLCCRMSPLQKSQIVRLVKHSSFSPITAAIGDGANDVSMIQEAHVGIGIIGREGRQAVRCSDFAFSRFRFLKKALLVHGHYYYTRAAMLVQYFFYKNVSFVFPQFVYIFFSQFSAQPLYNSAFLMMYNLCFTSLPVFIYGFTEKQELETKLMNNPVLYRKLSGNSILTMGQFIKWVMLGLWHGAVCFFGTYFFWSDSPLMPSSGRTLGMWSFGTAIFPVIVVIANLKLALHARYWTPFFGIALLMSLGGFVAFTALFSGVHWSVNTSILYGVYFLAISSAQIWLLSLVLIITAIIPDVICLLLEKHSLNPLSVLYKVYNMICQQHRYFPFAFTKSNNEPAITLSQINIFDESLESHT